MKKKKILLPVFILSLSIGLMASMFFGLTSCNNRSTTDSVSRSVSFDVGWRFMKDSLSGVENPDFNDSSWRILDIPHDWSIEDLPETTPGKIRVRATAKGLKEASLTN